MWPQTDKTTLSPTFADKYHHLSPAREPQIHSCIQSSASTHLDHEYSSDSKHSGMFTATEYAQATLSTGPFLVSGCVCGITSSTSEIATFKIYLCKIRLFVFKLLFF